MHCGQILHLSGEVDGVERGPFKIGRVRDRAQRHALGARLKAVSSVMQIGLC